MTDESRRAMNARLSALEALPERRARIRARIAQQSAGEGPLVKRRLSVSLVVAIILVVALGGMAAAEMAGLNVFGLFTRGGSVRSARLSEQDLQALESIREKGTLISAAYTPLNDGIPQGYVEIHDAYYDGEVLFLGEIIRDPQEFAVAWTPTEEDLKAMKAEPWEEIANARTVILFAHAEEEKDVYAAYNEALQAWQPFGLKRYCFIDEGNPYQTTEGSRLQSADISAREWINGEATYVVAKMQAPLPEEIRQRETVEIQLPVRFHVESYWFDGARLYRMSEDIDAGVITAVIGRDPDTCRRHYRSEPFDIGGVTVRAEAEVSPYLAHVTLRAEEPIFPLAFSDSGDEEDPWHLDGYDGQGRPLRAAYAETHVSYDDKARGSEVIRFYTRSSEDGLTYQRYLHLYGELPETLAVAVGRGGMRTITVELKPVD